MLPLLSSTHHFSCTLRTACLCLATALYSVSHTSMPSSITCKQPYAGAGAAGIDAGILLACRCRERRLSACWESRRRAWRVLFCWCSCGALCLRLDRGTDVGVNSLSAGVTSLPARMVRNCMLYVSQYLLGGYRRNQQIWPVIITGYASADSWKDGHGVGSGCWAHVAMLPNSIASLRMLAKALTAPLGVFLPKSLARGDSAAATALYAPLSPHTLALFGSVWLLSRTACAPISVAGGGKR